MPSHHCNRSAVFRVLLIAWLFFSVSIVNGQAPAPQTVEASYQQKTLRKFTFKNAKAADVVKLMEQLSGGEKLNEVAVDERTNSLIYLADDEDAREFEQFYSFFDAATPITPDLSKGLSVPIPALGPQPAVFDFSIGFERGEPVESLKQRDYELEQQTRQLAEKLRQSKSPSESERSELHAAVRKSFEARQALQRAELTNLARRLQSMQQSIDRRDKLADKIVERRVEDLLNPNLKWDAGQLSEQLLTGPTKAPSNPAMHLPRSAVPSNASVPYTPGDLPAKSSVQLATSRLLAAYRVPPNFDPNEPPKVIALIDVDYQGKQEAGDLREEIYQWITNNVSGVSPLKFTLLSRKLVELAMMEAGLRPGDLSRSSPSFLENRQRVFDQCRRHDVKLDALLIPSLKHWGDSDTGRQNQFELTLEGFIDARSSWFERVNINGKVNELLSEVQPTTESPKDSITERSNSRTITRKYSVGSFVTECFFAGKSSYDTKDVYDKYETEIEQSLHDLAKTVTATCTQLPKFVQVLRSSRCLLIGHSEAGHQEIASFMSDIDVNNDRIRLRGESVIITSNEAKALGIDLTKPVLLTEEVTKLREFQQGKRNANEDSANRSPFEAMDETIQSGTRTNLKSSEIGLKFPIAARIVPGTKELQIRLDFEGETGGVHYYAPRFQTLSNGQAAMFGFGDFYWIATADIVRHEIVGAVKADKASANAVMPATPAKETQSDGVSGVIVDETGMPLAHSQISIPGSQVARTNAHGEFHYPLPKDQQRVLEAYHPGFRNWYGSARGGDVVRIQLQNKTKLEQVAGKRKMSVRLIDSQTAEPISGVIVEVEKFEGPQKYQIAAERLTNKDGIAEFDELEFMRYRLRQKATKPIPYIPTVSYLGSADVDEVVVLLKQACDLTLRAVDSETGVGIQGVQFARERAEAEFWADTVVSETISVDRNQHKNTLTDTAGYAHFLVGPETWSYMIQKFPEGYNSIVPINGGYETTIETPVGGKVEFVFRLSKAKANTQ